MLQYTLATRQERLDVLELRLSVVVLQLAEGDGLVDQPEDGRECRPGLHTQRRQRLAIYASARDQPRSG